MNLAGKNVYINYRTEEERQMVMDILEHIGATWRGGQLLKYIEPNRSPAYIKLLSNNTIQKGMGIITEQSKAYRYPIVEASDLRNQWIAIKRGKR